MSDSQKTERNVRELEYQRAKASSVGRVRPTSARIVERYRRHRNWRIYPKEFLFERLGDVRGLHVLDFGCGTGELTTQLALLGAERVTGFDLSPDLVDVARARAAADGVEDRVRLFVGDGEEIALEGDSFDAVFLMALLHHTDYVPVMERVLGLLKPGGRVFIMEPVSYSRVLAAIRDLLPLEKDVSPDERQLNAADIERIRGFFAESEVRHFHAFGRLRRLLAVERPRALKRAVTFATEAIQYADHLLFHLPGFWRAAGTTVIIGTKARSPR